MAREHQIYWLSTEESGEDGVGKSWYYIRDARSEAQRLANELNCDVYINQGDNIVEVISPKNHSTPIFYVRSKSTTSRRSWESLGT